MEVEEYLKSIYLRASSNIWAWKGDSILILLKKNIKQKENSDLIKLSMDHYILKLH